MSLDLDERQRAMLKMMGVQVWWPKTMAEPVQTDNSLVSELNIKFNQKIVLNISKNVAKNISNSRLELHNNSVDTLDKINNHIAEDVASLTWPALQQVVASCRACTLCEGRTQTVFGVGQASAGGDAAPPVDWLVVGEAPGENEDRVGEPFVGQAGQLLDNMLKAMKLSRRDNVYIANVIKCRPPGNRNPTHDEVAQCEPYLHRQIALLQPKMILALGKYAATSLLRASVPEVEKTPLGKLRGRVHAYTHAGLTIPVVASYHPAYLLRSLTEKAKAWEDLCLAMDSLAQQQQTPG